jgi:hypothetical protein
MTNNYTAGDPPYKHKTEWFGKKLARFFPNRTAADNEYTNTEAEYFRQLNLGVVKEATIWTGSGVPALSTVPNGGTAGDLYVRTDTPGTSSQRLYFCTVSGTSAALGTFVALAV